MGKQITIELTGLRAKEDKVGDYFDMIESEGKKQPSNSESKLNDRVLFHAGESETSKACNGFGEALQQMKENCPEEFQDLVDKGLIKINQKK